MVATIVEIARFRYETVSFYTVRVGKNATQFEDFARRMSGKCPRQFGELMHFIDEIGSRIGAGEQHFRHERNAHALPPNYIELPAGNLDETTEYGLRLYCCRFTPEIVMLYNGDLKTHHYPDKCPNVSPHFNFAIQATKQIDKALRDGYLTFNGLDIEIDPDFELDI